MYLAEDGFHCASLLSTVLIRWARLNVGGCLTGWSTVGFWGRTVLHGVCIFVHRIFAALVLQLYDRCWIGCFRIIFKKVGT